MITAMASGKALVDALAHRALAVGLEALDFRAQFLAQRLQVGVDLGERDRPYCPDRLAEMLWLMPCNIRTLCVMVVSFS